MLNPDPDCIQDRTRTSWGPDAKREACPLALTSPKGSVGEPSLSAGPPRSAQLARGEEIKDARCVHVSSARGSAGRAGARGGRAGRARAAAAGVEPDLKHLLTGAPRFAPAGREGVPGFPWRA